MMATMDSRINVASSGPRIASMTPGSTVDEGTRVFVASCEAVALLIDHSKSAFERLSMVALMKEAQEMKGRSNFGTLHRSSRIGSPRPGTL